MYVEPPAMFSADDEISSGDARCEISVETMEESSNLGKHRVGRNPIAIAIHWIFGNIHFIVINARSKSLKSLGTDARFGKTSKYIGWPESEYRLSFRWTEHGKAFLDTGWTRPFKLHVQIGSNMRDL